MESLLFLTHRIPFPPNKGDKIRSFNLLKALSQQYQVFLGTFIDDIADIDAEQGVGEFCEEVFALKINPTRRRLRSLTALLGSRPLSIEYYQDEEFSEWVSKVIVKHGISRIVCFSAATAQFVESDTYSSLSRIIDLVDVDSEKWREYSNRRAWPFSWLYRRESETLRAYEIGLAKAFDAVSLVTDAEAALFRTYEGVAGEKVHAIPNGVDTDYFSPDQPLENPFAKNEIPLVFTGAMDYWANVDAVNWFASEMFAVLKRQMSGLTFWIVGARPTNEVRKLTAIDGVNVTGSVTDVRPYIHHAKLSVAPMRIARGVQNKVLEAMAMAKPVVATTHAMEGIEIGDRNFGLIGDEPADIIDAVMTVLKSDQASEMGAAGRQYVLAHHHWDAQTNKLSNLIETISK